MLTHIWEAEFHTRTYFFSSSVAVLQSIKKKENVSQSVVSLCDPMNCILLGSSVCEILWARILEWVAISFSRGVFLTQGSNPGLLHCRQILYF